MQTPFPPLFLPPSPPLSYPVLPNRPYDAGLSVAQAAAAMDYSGGAWYNNLGDFQRVFTEQLPNEFTNPQSDLRSGRFLNRVSAVANSPLLDMGSVYAGPEAVAGLQAARAGLTGFRALTGLGYPHGGARTAAQKSAQKAATAASRAAGMAARLARVRSPGATVSSVRGLNLVGSPSMPGLDYGESIAPTPFSPAAAARTVTYMSPAASTIPPPPFAAFGPVRTRKPRKPKQQGYADYVHAGYNAAGLPLAVTATRSHGYGVGTLGQSVARKAFTRPGGPADQWRAFVASRPGISRDVLSAEWRASRPGVKRRAPGGLKPTQGREYKRYLKLQRDAAKAGVAAIWETSQGAQPFANRPRKLMISGHPYGYQWSDAAGLHGSGRVYG